MKRFAWIVMLSVGLAARAAGAAEAPVGQWKTVDEKSGAVESVAGRALGSSDDFQNIRK